MPEYKIEVTTGDRPFAGTWDHIYVTMVGTEGKSERTELNNWGIDFSKGTTGTYTLSTDLSLGKPLLLHVEKKAAWFVPHNEWYLTKMVVTTPEGEAILFPSNRWISRGDVVELRGGRALIGFEEEYPLLIKLREEELIFKKNLFKWNNSAEGLPHKTAFTSVWQLPAEIRFSISKVAEVVEEKIQTEFDRAKTYFGSDKKWESFEQMKEILPWKKTTMSEYVTEHWREDSFFGYQFLNGANPNVIKRCSKLPPNFPVTEEMVKPSLEEGSSLQEEMKKGNIFLYDQKKMDGITPREHDGKPLHVTAGLCLLYLNPENKLMPIAIQLHQQPSEQNPIFLPSDLETDWLLAKMFIKNADSMDHEAVQHLMKTHFLAEAYNVAALRSFSVIHPIYKLLIPHFRYTLYINTGGRPVLFGPDGALSTSSLGDAGLKELMRRALSEMTYSSLCLPEDITARGLDSIPNFYYRDDGLKLWNIIKSFVQDVVEYYYHSDSDVHKDTELQDWISEIFTHGFLGNKASGIPDSFRTVEEVIKFITLVIFTVTVQHAAVNNGQFDYYCWAPNVSLLLCKPPPTTKGQSSMATILETLPNVEETLNFTSLVSILSETYSDVVPMGTYPKERFDEHAVKQMMKEFQADLSNFSQAIIKRNKQLDIPYSYLDPSQIENSIAI